MLGLSVYKLFTDKAKFPNFSIFFMSISHFNEIRYKLTIINPHVDDMIATVEKTTRKCRKAV